MPEMADAGQLLAILVNDSFQLPSTVKNWTESWWNVENNRHIKLASFLDIKNMLESSHSHNISKCSKLPANSLRGSCGVGTSKWYGVFFLRGWVPGDVKVDRTRSMSVLLQVILYTLSEISRFPVLIFPKLSGFCQWQTFRKPRCLWLLVILLIKVLELTSKESGQPLTTQALLL